MFIRIALIAMVLLGSGAPVGFPMTNTKPGKHAPFSATPFPLVTSRSADTS